MKTVNLAEFSIKQKEMVCHRSKLGFNPYRKFEIPKKIDIDGIIFDFDHGDLSSAWGVVIINVPLGFKAP